MERTQSIDKATRQAQEQIQAARLKAERELERATKQAHRALEKANRTSREHPRMLTAIAGTAVMGGIAAWLLSRKRAEQPRYRRPWGKH